MCYPYFEQTNSVCTDRIGEETDFCLIRMSKDNYFAVEIQLRKISISNEMMAQFSMYFISSNLLEVLICK